MPSPPKEKIIDNKKEIETIIKIVNGARTDFRGFYMEAGWEGLIIFSNGKTITLVDNCIIYNNFKYSLTDKEYKKLFDISKTLYIKIINYQRVKTLFSYLELFLKKIS